MALDWSTALPDWEERILSGASLVPELPLFDDYAARAVKIFCKLRAPDVIGQPTLGEISEPWVIDFVRALFGCYDPDEKRRMIQEYFLMVPKKNYKSGIASGIMLTAMILNERPNAEMVLVSETQKIAGIAFRNVQGMIALDGTLSSLFHVVEHQKKVKHLTSLAELQIVSADGDVVTGSKASCILIDEAHVLGMKAKAPTVYLELQGGLASRPEGFFLEITTQSKVEPAGQFKKQLDRARAQRDGRAENGMLAVIYELPRKMVKDEAWKDPATWRLVNPNYGLSVDQVFLHKQFEKAKTDGPEALALFASQHLNVEIGIGLHSNRWIACDYWPGATTENLGFDELIERSEVVTIGGDGGGADDLFAFCAIGRCAQTQHRLVWSRAWCVEAVLTNRKEIAPKLLDLQDVGDLVISDDVGAHVDEFVDLVRQVMAANLLPDEAAIGLDAYGIGALVDALLAEGLTLDQVQAVRQGFALTGAIKGIERRLIQGTLIHGGQPLMTWCMGNAKAEARGNNVLITKERAGVGKIDPLIAMFNATVFMDRNPQARGPSVYRSRGALVM